MKKAVAALAGLILFASCGPQGSQDETRVQTGETPDSVAGQPGNAMGTGTQTADPGRQTVDSGSAVTDSFPVDNTASPATGGKASGRAIGH